MNIFLEEHELTEIKPVSETEDKGLVITPRTGEKDVPKQEISDFRKEVAAIDSLTATNREVANLHGIGKTNAARYAKGEGLTEEAKTNLLSIRTGIQDLAVVKLMETLNLVDPNLIEKERDKIAVMVGLSQVIEKLNPGNKEGSDKPTVHLHLYSPPQKLEKDYEVIDA